MEEQRTQPGQKSEAVQVLVWRTCAEEGEMPILGFQVSEMQRPNYFAKACHETKDKQVVRLTHFSDSNTSDVDFIISITATVSMVSSPDLRKSHLQEKSSW